MLATSRGALACLSTPFGKRGWFYDAWAADQPWERVRVTAPDCPRIPAEFLWEERQALGDRWFRQEYECSFEEAVDGVFRHDDQSRNLGRCRRRPRCDWFRARCP